MAQMEGAVSFQELIRQKRNGGQLSAEQIRTFIKGVTSGTMQESQIGAMLMAIWQKGMVEEETLALTKEMMISGEVFHWPEEWAGLVVDKHSTGGVGDKISLPLAPALAACGCKVPMISGRGLAHTGGTLDKLESIPGFTVHQSEDQVRKILQEVGCCIVGQTETLVPADRVLYALRDATATVDSPPLIAGSIISKKGAEGLSALLLDVKFGSAALYKDLDSARSLAQLLVTVGNSLGVKTGAVLSRMDAPIGRFVGNSLEVCEALECLKGRGSDDLKDLVTYLGCVTSLAAEKNILLEKISIMTPSAMYGFTGHLQTLMGSVKDKPLPSSMETLPVLGGCLLWMSGQSGTVEDGKRRISEVLGNGKALLKFQAMLKAQGVPANIAQALCSDTTDYSKHLKLAKHQTELPALFDGVVMDIKGLVIATVLHELGAGRFQAGESINHSVGAELLVDLGQHIQRGQPWIRVHHDCPELSTKQKDELRGSLVIGGFGLLERVAEFIKPR